MRPAPRPSSAPTAQTPAPSSAEPALGEQLQLFGAERRVLPCAVEIEYNYGQRTAIVRRQADDGTRCVLAHVGAGAVQTLKRWHSHLEPSERRQIVEHLQRALGPMQVLK